MDLAPESTGHPPAAAAQRARRDRVAVAALVTGILPAVPFALVLGPVALRRTRRDGTRGAALAVTGIALASAWILGAAAAAALVTLGRPRPARPAPLPAVFSMHAGQCIDTAQNGIAAAHVVNCASAHDAEIYAAYRLAGRRWPGAAVLSQEAGQGCGERIGGYLNPQLATTSLVESFVYPDPGAWAAGERTVICEIRSTSGTLTGSVRAAD